MVQWRCPMILSEGGERRPRRPVGGSMDTRQRIIDAAIRVFNRYGILAPVSKITEEAGIAAGTPFRYFKTKDELLYAAYLYARNSSQQVRTDDPRLAGDAEGAIKSIGRTILKWAVTMPEEYQYTCKYEDAVAYDCFSDTFRDRLYCGIIRELDLWEKLRDSVRPDLPEDVISRMISVNCSVYARYIQHMQMAPDAPETASAIEAFVDSLWNSVRKQPPCGASPAAPSAG